MICGRIIFICLLFPLFSTQASGLFAQKAEEVVQQLHNKISNDLLSIRKEYPKSQPVVYSVLDQVCKIYQISKSAIEGKKRLKETIKTRDLENKLLKGENLTLKNEISSLQNELGSTQQNLTSIAKKLEQKNMVINFMAKEKQKLAIEKEKLEEEKKTFLKESKNNNNGQNSIVNINNQPEKITQSLSLTSTCAPSSPL